MDGRNQKSLCELYNTSNSNSHTRSVFSCSGFVSCMPSDQHTTRSPPLNTFSYRHSRHRHRIAPSNSSESHNGDDMVTWPKKTPRRKRRRELHCFWRWCSAGGSSSWQSFTQRYGHNQNSHFITKQTSPPPPSSHLVDIEAKRTDPSRTELKRRSSNYLTANQQAATAMPGGQAGKAFDSCHQITIPFHLSIHPSDIGTATQTLWTRWTSKATKQQATNQISDTHTRSQPEPNDDNHLNLKCKQQTKQQQMKDVLRTATTHFPRWRGTNCPHTLQTMAAAALPSRHKCHPQNYSNKSDMHFSIIFVISLFSQNRLMKRQTDRRTVSRCIDKRTA